MPRGGTWTAPRRLVDAGIASGYTQYGNSLAVGPDGTLHLGFHIYEEVAPAAGKSLGYLRSRDAGATWEAADGTPVALPATPRSPCFIEQGRSLDMRIGDVVVDATGAPWLAGVHFKPVPTVRLYHWEGGGWESVDLLPFLQEALAATFPVEGSMTFDREGTLYVLAATVEEGYATTFGDPSGEVALLASFDRGASFDVVPFPPAASGVPSWLPSIERPYGTGAIDVPSLIYTQGAVGEGLTGGPTTVVFARVARQ
jgi:hypothetical protein